MAPSSEMMRPLYEDRHFLIFSKPPGLLSVPGRGEDKQDCLIHRIQCMWPDALTVHRLDQVTSGVMVFARSPEIHRALSDAFATRRVQKTYEALVEGELRDDSGTVDLPLICDWPNRPRQIVAHAIGKPAQTHWTVLSRHANHTRVALEPHTGRTHQLRVHMQALGHPVIGDVFYDALPAPRVMLHARALTFHHPATQEHLTFQDPTPF